MRERKNIKLRVDMNEDTKFKIIDRKPERDLIYCIWIKLLLLAGKVNKEGELHLSRNIPYTIETLAIEFNRDADQVRLALEVFLDLEMIEMTKHNVYKVKNFAKHQNIKVKEQNGDLGDIEEKNKVVNNEGIIENVIETESQSVVKDINDDNKTLNDEVLIFNNADIKIDTNQGEKDKCEDEKIDKIKDSKFNEEIDIFDTKKLVGEEIGNIEEHKQNKIGKVADAKIINNNNQINDTESVDKNILSVDKPKKSNRKKKKKVFKDGFQDEEEKYTSETWERFDCFEEKEGDRIIMEWDFS